MNKIILLGFTNEYEKIDVEQLSNFHQISNFSLTRIDLFFLVRLFRYFNGSFFILKYLEFVFKRSRIKFDSETLIISTDNYIYSRLLTSDLFYENKKVLLFRNTVDSYFKSLIDKYKGVNNLHLYSFDHYDCEKYGLDLYRQYCSGFDILLRNKSNNHGEYKYDFYFLGLDKGRSSALRVFESKLNPLYSLSIVIIKDSNSFISKVLKRFFNSSGYSNKKYSDYLDDVLLTKVLIDYVKPGQLGLTMRPLDAIVASRKLITNNASILNEKFYNSNNILYLESFTDFDVEKVVDFVKLPYADYSLDFLYGYSFKKVVDDIILEL